MSKPSDDAVDLLHEIAAGLREAGPVELGTNLPRDRAVAAIVTAHPSTG